MSATSPNGAQSAPAAVAGEPQRLRLALAATGCVAYDWDVAAGLIHWSDNAEAVLGADAAASAAFYQSRIAPDDAPLRALALTRHLRTREPFHCEYKLRRADGRMEWIEERGHAECDGAGEPVRLVGALRVVTAHKQHLSRLERLAFHDDLTGLLNRGRLRERVEEGVEACLRDNSGASLLVVNIDNLGMLNEAYGYDVTDEVILAIARRAAAAAGPDDCLARIGGNQFGLLLEDESGRRMEAAAHRILEQVRASVIETLAGPIAVSVSIGGVDLPGSARTFDAALARAEEALEQAKRGGRDRFVVFRHSPERVALRRRTLATGDRVLAALKERRLRLAFQPIVVAGAGDIVMHECLLRMLDDAGEAMAAAAFIPVVEKLGMVRQIDRRSLELAIEELEVDEHIRLAVNVSGMTATDASARANLLALVKAHAHVAPRLIFEITETVAMGDIHESAQFAKSFRDLGCGVALDDFGAGYTSFRHLKQLAIDIVKIDGQFVKDVATSADNQLFVRTLMSLARGFGLKTVAETVETVADAEVLAEYGVDYLQGYLFGRPSLERPWSRIEARRAQVGAP
jgi:diguanylate cyclase (GGDEF)-like protein